MPNVEGGRENLEAIAFLKRLNEVVYGHCGGVATFAEESTAFPGVSRPTGAGGLGFGYKWNMGWMNDTLGYMKRDPDTPQAPPSPDDLRHSLRLLGRTSCCR